MVLVKKIHQIFFDFDGKVLEDYPAFSASRAKFKNMEGWSYTLWDESMVADAIKQKYPHVFDEYNALPHAIQKVDLAKYIIADAFGGVVADLDVIPSTHLENIVSSPCTFDRCSRANVVANDFFYTEIGLPGIFEYFSTNLARVKSIPVYKIWKMRFIFQTTGPDFFTRYLKKAGLNKFTKRLSCRSFMDPRQNYRAVSNPHAKLKIMHHLSWTPHVCSDGRNDKLTDARRVV